VLEGVISFVSFVRFIGGTVLRLRRIGKVYRVGAFGSRKLTAVHDVSFDISAGEVVSLIGESGSGKTTIGRMVLRLASASTGTITLDGHDIAGFSKGRLKTYYRNVQGVFQDPFSSYNPIFKVDRVFDVVRSEFFPDVAGREWRHRVRTAVEAVRLDPGQVLGRYPHQLSGGQLQRLLIARALLLDIRFLVADEIISMLDASTRIDVLNLLGDLAKRGLGILFITHDLSLGHYLSDKTVILRRGSVVELGETGKVFGGPLHPYTRTLVASVPQLHRRWGHADPAGRCLYHQRFPSSSWANGERPALAEIEPDHLVACYRSNWSAALGDCE
jgi:ABC-type oligopeptide transport system ATPase subunit